MYIISIDTATKSMALSIIEYNTEINKQISELYTLYKYNKKKVTTITEVLQLYIDLLDNISNLIENKIKIHHLDVIDLIPGKKISETDIIFRTKQLHIYLKKIDILIDKLDESKKKLFLLEYQMGPNIQSNVISSQLMYHFTKYSDSEIKIIGPSLKNKVYIGGDDGKYSNFLEKYKTLYAANKNHTKYNFLKLMSYLNNNNFSHIKKKNIDDIADSVLMSLAYYLTN